MSLKGKLAKAILLVALISVPFGTPMTHKEIEDIQRAMNQQQVEIVIPQRDDNGDPKYWPPVRLGGKG
jgi:hypothetical protein